MINIPFAKVKALSFSADKMKCTAECNDGLHKKRRKNTGKKYIKNRQMYTSQ